MAPVEEEAVLGLENMVAVEEEGAVLVAALLAAEEEGVVAALVDVEVSLCTPRFVSWLTWYGGIFFC